MSDDIERIEFNGGLILHNRVSPINSAQAAEIKLKVRAELGNIPLLVIGNDWAVYKVDAHDEGSSDE